jgi:hypothetical protein
MLQSELFDQLFTNSNLKSDTKILPDNNSKLDIVYTFVDTSDKKWIDKATKYGRKPSGIRYDRTHILFSLQTVAKYFPTVNKIYIVSDNQRFDLSSVRKIASKIRWIDHKTIIPKEYLPTFNSRVIEAFLWNISDLSEHFLYLNDDFILGKQIDENLFFNSDGLPIQFYWKSSKQHNHVWYKNIAESNLLFQQKFPSWIPFLYPQHSVYHIQKKYLKASFEIFEKDLRFMFQNHKFRKYDNAHNLIFLYAMFMDHHRLAINKLCSFKHIFNFTDGLIESTIRERKTFYAIASSLSRSKEIINYEKFKQNILQ